MRSGIRQAILLGVVLLSRSAAAEAGGRPVSFPSIDGVTLTAQLYEAAARPAPGVVLVHMLARSKADWDEFALKLEDAGITSLALDLRGHGGSGGSAANLQAMAQDVRAAVHWLSGRSGVRPDAIGVAGASLGANLALIVAADQSLVRVVAAVSPSLDYRGVRVGAELMRKLGDKRVWLGASSEDPFAARTLHELTVDGGGRREQYQTPTVAHGTNLLAADASFASGLVDWLRQRLLS